MYIVLGATLFTLAGMFVLVATGGVKIKGLSPRPTMKTPAGVWKWIEENRPANGYVKGVASRKAFALPNSTDAIIVDVYHTTENKMFVRTCDDYSYAFAGIDPDDIYTSPYVFKSYGGQTGIERAEAEIAERNRIEQRSREMSKSKWDEIHGVANI